MFWLLACTSSQPAVETMHHEEHTEGHAEQHAEGHAEEHAEEHAEGHAGHSHTAPHEGVVQMLGGMHAEAVFSPTGILFYLSDGEQKPLTVEGYSGSVAIQGPAGLSTVSLEPMNDHLHATVALEQGKPASAVLTLNHAGTAMSALFSVPAVGLALHDHASLHGGQVSMWGDYHVEYVAQGCQFWLSDAHRNAIMGTISGSVQSGTQKYPLQSKGSGLLSGECPAGVPVMLSAVVDGASFDLAFGAAATSP